MIQRWVVVDESTREIVVGPHDWNGPVGSGDLWTNNEDGTVWVSDERESRVAPDEVTQWVPPVPGRSALESWALAEGYVQRPMGPPEEGEVL